MTGQGNTDMQETVYPKNLEAENIQLYAQVEELRKALSDLCDLQNGAPLIKYEKEWNEARRLTTKYTELRPWCPF